MYVDALVSRSLAYADQLFNTDTGNLTIRRDNVFLPQQIRDILAANGNPATFQIGRLDTEAGVFETDVTTKVQRYTVGIDGTMFGDWNWGAYVQVGRNNYDRYDHNNRIVAYNAISNDALVREDDRSYVPLQRVDDGAVKRAGLARIRMGPFETWHHPTDRRICR